MTIRSKASWKTRVGCPVRKAFARWSERIGLKWAITKSAWGGKYPPPTHEEAVKWFLMTPRNQFYDDHFVGVKNKTDVVRTKEK